MMEQDIIAKVFCMKEMKWHEEKEWRKVFELKPGDINIHYLNEKPYVEYCLDKSFLTGITIFGASDTMSKTQENADEIADYISGRGYNAEVRIEKYE